MLALAEHGGYIRIMLMVENSPKSMLEKIWGFDSDKQCKIIFTYVVLVVCT